MKYERRFLTIPNIFSILRILLIPEFVWLYTVSERQYAIIILVLSAVSDLLDGDAARRLGQISRVGRVLDPVADKLTQLAVAVCLIADYPYILTLVFLLAAKEGLAAVAGLYLITHKGEPFDSLVFGKVATGMLYLLGIALLIGVPDEVGIMMTIPTGLALIISFVSYTVEYADRIGTLRISQSENKTDSHEEI